MRISDWSSDVCSSDLTAWMLDQGSRGNPESSMSKVFVSEAVWRVVDRCVQMLGGQGVTSETIVMRIFKDMRAFRIYDGPSEEIGRAHVCTPVTNAHLVCRLRLAKNNNTIVRSR